jgi:predicted extracellular nuclease
MKKYSLQLFILVLFFFTQFNIQAQTNFTMNEVYSRGTTSDPDWIEIYNSSSSAVDLSGFKIYDVAGRTGTKPKKDFPSGSIIPANEFLVIVTDDTSASGFGLSSSGESVWIENASGIVVDSVVFPALQTTESYSRVPNGQSWIITNSITRGTSNIYSNPTSIVMNEIYSRGITSDPDWIEIYNPSSFEISLTGYKIYDAGGQAGTKPKKSFPSGTFIPANGFIIIVTDDTASSGFGLSSNGEEVWLEDASGLIIDDVTFPSMDTTQSYCRFPDGTTAWQISNYITKGLQNSITDINDDEANLALDFVLNQNYPNPFNPSTTISYSLPFESTVIITIFNSLGEVVKELVNSSQQSGYHSVSFKAVDISSGIYFYAISAYSINGQQEFNSVRKMTLLK